MNILEYKILYNEVEGEVSLEWREAERCSHSIVLDHLYHAYCFERVLVQAGYVKTEDSYVFSWENELKDIGKILTSS